MKRVLVATGGSGGAVAFARAADVSATLVCVRRDPPALAGSPLYERALSAELRQARAAIDARERQEAA